MLARILGNKRKKLPKNLNDKGYWEISQNNFKDSSEIL